jgi:hypothetical protein
VAFSAANIIEINPREERPNTPITALPSSGVMG